MSRDFSNSYGRTARALAVVLACAAIFIVTPRLLALPFALAVVVTAVMWTSGKRWRYVGLALVGFVAVSICPVDVRPKGWVGTPRVIPVVMGLPDAELRKAAQNGDVWLGGCLVSGLEPRWVITW